MRRREGRDGVVVVVSEDVKRDTASGSAEEESGTETARGPIVLSEGGSVDDEKQLALGRERRRWGEEESGREDRREEGKEERG